MIDNPNTDNPNVLEYVKNYENGLATYMYKDKDMNRVVQTEIKVEVKNEDGSLDQESLSTNCINNSAIFDMFYLQFLNAQALGASTVCGCHFGNIFLTDYAGAEDPSLPIIQGEIIGWADTTDIYSGTNQYQGTLIPSLSYITPTEFCFTVEFDGMNANGTFRTAWFSSAPPVFNGSHSDLGGLGFGMKKAEYLDGAFSSVSGTICADENGRVYKFGSSATYSYDIVDMGLRKSIVSAGTLPKPSVGAPSYACYIKETQQFWVNTATTQPLYIINKDMSYYKQVGLPENYPQTSIKRATNGRGDTVYLSGQGKLVYIYTKSGNYTGRVEDLSPYMEGNESPYDMWTDTDCEYIWFMVQRNDALGMSDYYREVVFKLNDDGTFADNFLCSNEVTEIASRHSIPLYGKRFFIANGQFLFRSFIEPGSQTLLSAPVHKTLGQVMTIQYKFKFQ